MNKNLKHIVAFLLTFVMVFASVPLSGTDFSVFGQGTVAAAAKEHKHKKVTTVKKATLSKNGQITVKCSSCGKTISKKTVSKIASVKLSKTSLTYSGKALKPSVTVKDSAKKTLKLGKDYTVTYKNNKTPGKATVTVTFKGNYSGTKTLSFTIVPTLSVKKTSSSLSLSWTKVPDAKTYKVSLYNGKKLVKTVSTSKTSAKFTKLQSLKSYKVAFKAVNKKNKNVLSAEYSVKTDSKAVTVQLSDYLETLDPAFSTSTADNNMILTLFEPLLIVDKNGKVKPGQAKSYKVSKDGLTWTFTMRDGLKWSDGSALNAKDFEYSFKRLADVEIGAPYSGIVLEMIDGYYQAIGEPNSEGKATTTPNKNKLNVKASKDGKTLTVKLSYPCSYFDRIVAMAALCPVKKSVVEKYYNAWTFKAKTFVSNGPYIFESRNDNKVVFKKNPNYVGGWDSEKIVAEKLNFLLADADASYTAYSTNSAQLILNVPYEELEDLKKKSDFKKSAISGTYYINMNLSKAPFNNKLVRKALSLAIDREYISNVLMQGTYLPSYNLIGQGVADGNNMFLDTAKKMNGGKTYISSDYKSNLAEAKAALAKAGYPNGKGLPAITYSTNDAGYHFAIAEYLSETYRSLGITLNVKEVDWSDAVSDRREGNYDMSRNGWILDYNDAFGFLSTFHSQSWNNDGKYNSKSFDKAIDDAAGATSYSAHSKALHEAEKILMNDYAVIPVATYCDTWLQKPALKGVWHSAEGYFYLQYAYLA